MLPLQKTWAWFPAPTWDGSCLPRIPVAGGLMPSSGLQGHPQACGARTHTQAHRHTQIECEMCGVKVANDSVAAFLSNRRHLYARESVVFQTSISGKLYA